MLIVFALNFILTKKFADIDPSYIDGYGIQAKNIAAILALIAALTSGIIITVLIGWKRMFGEG